MTLKQKFTIISNISLLSFGAIAFGTGGLGCSESEAESSNDGPPIPVSRVVVVTEAEAGPLVREHRYGGVVQAAQRADLTFTLSGRVEQRPAEIGATVKRGAILAVLDRRPLRNALSAARARRTTLTTQLEQSGRDAKRAERLRSANAIGAEELEKTVAGRDTLSAQLAAANAEVAEASRLLGEATLRAPFEGTVIDVRVEPGEFAQAGRPAILLSGEKLAEVEVEVPESLRSIVSVGESAAIRFPLAGGTEVTGTILRVGRAAAGAGRLIKVVVALPKDSGAAPGATAEVVLKTTSRAALTVPIAAIVDPSGSRPAIFRVNEGIATLVSLELGDIYGDKVVVRSGIAAGDHVVTAGHANLISGEQVEEVSTEGATRIGGE